MAHYIDRTLVEQGVGRIPQTYVGAHANAMKKRGYKGKETILFKEKELNNIEDRIDKLNNNTDVINN